MMDTFCGFDILSHDADEIGVDWGDVGRNVAGAGHLTGKTLLNLFAEGAGTQQLEQLEESKNILPSWAEGPPSLSYSSPDYVGIVHKDGRQESFKAPKKVEGRGGKLIPGNGYVTGDNPGEKFTVALSNPTKVTVDDKTFLDAAFVFVHGGTSQTQSSVGHMDTFCGFDFLGCDDDDLDEIGDQVLTIPKANVEYTDAKTVAAVQSALVKRGYDLGDYGPNHDGVDGLFGRKTKTAIEKMQKDAGLLVTGTINEDVIMALKVTPGVLPPGVTPQGVAAVQAQIALDAATAAEHAQTPAEVQKAAQDAANAANTAQPPLPPEVREAAMDALDKAKKATTPAQVQLAKQDVQAVAKTTAAQVAPNWWTQPAWNGGWERWKVAAAGTGGALTLGALFAWLVSSAAGAAVRSE